MTQKDTNKTAYSAYMKAFLEYLRRPKTIYDIKDRTRCFLLLLFVIIVLQKVVRWLGY